METTNEHIPTKESIELFMTKVRRIGRRRRRKAWNIPMEYISQCVGLIRSTHVTVCGLNRSTHVTVCGLIRSMHVSPGPSLAHHITVFYDRVDWFKSISSQKTNFLDCLQGF